MASDLVLIQTDCVSIIKFLQHTATIVQQHEVKYMMLYLLLIDLLAPPPILFRTFSIVFYLTLLGAANHPEV